LYATLYITDDTSREKARLMKQNRSYWRATQAKSQR